MKKLQRLSAMLFAICLLAGMIPATVSATNNPDVAANNSNMTFESTNSFGYLLGEDLQQEQEREAENASEGYNVIGLTIEGNTAVVEYTSLEEAELVVALYTEDGMQMLCSGKTTVDPEVTEAIVTIKGDVPEYFMAAAYLVDTYDYSPLCEAYNTPMYTKEMQELLASTVDDYDEDLVLNFDEDETTNFAVFAEGVKIIDYAEGVNAVISADDENATYVIGNADSNITSLQPGDIFAYAYGEEQLLIVKVASIEIDGTTATIIGSEMQTEDAFSAVKIEGGSSTQHISVDDSLAGNGITYVGMDAVDDEIQTFAIEGGDTTTIAHKFSINTKAEEGSDHVSASLGVTGSISLQVDVAVKYYISVKTKFVEFKVTPKITFALEVNGNVTLKEKLGYLSVSPVPGVYVGFEPELQLKFDGKTALKASVSAVLGFKYDNQSGIQNISSAPDFDLKIQIDATVFAGIDFCPTVAIMDDSVSKISANMLVGAQVRATTSGYAYEVYEKDESSYHQCRECIAFDVSVVAEIGGSLQFLEQEWLTVKITIGKWTIPIGAMYYSVDNDVFDLGQCPNMTYRVSVEVLDKNKEKVTGTLVNAVSTDTKKTYEVGSTNENGVAVNYLPAGWYMFETDVDNETLRRNTYIAGACKVILDKAVIEREAEEKDKSSIIIDFTTPDSITDHGAAIASGNCGADGDNVTWKLLSDGLLQIQGSGDMDDYHHSSYGAPYYESPWYTFRSSVSKVNIEEGVTSIGDYAFEGLDNLKTITIPDSILSIGEYAFSNCTSLADIEIPSSVTSIGNYAFKKSVKLTSITIPKGVTSIGDYAFYNCTGLVYVSLSESITSLGSGAFSGCDSLGSITIPKSITSIGDSTFNNCDNLSSVTIHEGVTSIGRRAFYYCVNLNSIILPNSVTSIGTDAFYNCTNLTNIEIPNSVINIGDSVFYKCTNLTSITIPDSVVRIGEYTFARCSRLSNVNLPKGITEIGAYAFEYCYELTSITLTENVISIGDYAFYGCSDLSDFTIPKNVTSIGNYTFSGCSSLTSIIIPENVSSIGNSAFSGCSGISSVVIPEHVTSIGNYAFSGCTDLTNITLPESVISIGDGAFSGCERISNVTIPGSVTYLGDGAFSSCVSLTSITIPGSVTSISDSMFYSCSNLTNVTIAEGVNSIGYGAFSWCDSLTSITIPNSVTSIGDYAFSDCDNLTNITLPNGLTSIGEYAFEYCHKLTGITIPEGVTYIGEYAFICCCDLTSIILPGSVTSIEGWAFGQCDNVTSVTIGNGVTNIAESAFYGCDSLVSITIPESVTRIGSSAFNYCTNLTDVIYGGSEVQWNNISIGSGNSDLTEATVHFSNGTKTVVATALAAQEEKTEEIATEKQEIIIEQEAPILDAVFGGEYETEATPEYILKKASFSGLVPGQQYVLLAMASIEAKDVLDAENLLFIGQKAAEEDGTLVFTYVQRINMDKSYVVACGASNKNLQDATVTFPLMASDGTLHTVNPKVVYEGELLLEGIDYMIVGKADFVEAGTYSCTIRGVRNYTGVVICEYSVANCIHPKTEFVQEKNATCEEAGYEAHEVCTVCGDALEEYREIPAKGHNYESVITAPTPEASGYTTYTCTRCGDSYIDNYVEYEIVAEGTCGENLVWALDNNGVLSVSGEGNMDDYYLGGMDGVMSLGSPWYLLASKITSVHIAEGVTSIGAQAFNMCTRVTEIVMPDSITKIGNQAFKSCSGLKAISLSFNLGDIGNSAFSGCTKLSKIIFTGDAPRMKADSFNGVTATAYYPADNASWTKDIMQQYSGNITWMARYEVLEGDESTVELGRNPQLEIHVAGEIEKFEGVTVDGELVDPSNYTVTEGSTIVTFKSEYLKSLEEGDHTIQVHFTDGVAIADVSVEKPTYILGDVNSDGVVNAHDRVYLARYLAKWSDYPASVIDMDAADVNGDGVVNAHDRVYLARHLAKWTGYETLGA